MQGPLALAREARKSWQPASLVKEILAVVLPPINGLVCCRQLCSVGKQTLAAALLEHLRSWSSKVPDTTPCGCVSGSVPKWAVEMESRQCFDFGFRRKLTSCKSHRHRLHLSLVDYLRRLPLILVFLQLMQSLLCAITRTAMIRLRL